MRTILVLAILAGICLSAFGIANADDKKPTEMSQAEVTKWLRFFDKLVATVVKTSSGPCDKMAAQVNSVIDANQDAIAVARAAHAAGRKLPQPAQNHMMEGVKKMVPGMQRCGTDDKVRAAFVKLDLTRNAAAARR